MSVMIRGMKMPKSCVDCRFHKDIYCTLTDICTNTKQRCLLIELPPHGRLIDADALIARIRRAKELQPELSDLYENEALEMLLWVGTEPTIIEAEEVQNG